MIFPVFLIFWLSVRAVTFVKKVDPKLLRVHASFAERPRATPRRHNSFFPERKRTFPATASHGAAPAESAVDYNA